MEIEHRGIDRNTLEFNQERILGDVFLLANQMTDFMEDLEKVFSFSFLDGLERVVSFLLPDQKKEVRCRIKTQEHSPSNILTKISVGGDSVDHQMQIHIQKVRFENGIQRYPVMVYLTADQEKGIRFERSSTSKGNVDKRDQEDVFVFCNELKKLFQSVLDGLEESFESHRQCVRNGLFDECRFEVSKLVNVREKDRSFLFSYQKGDQSMKDFSRRWRAISKSQ